MPHSDTADRLYQKNVEFFGDYIRNLKKYGNEKKIKLLEKIFFEAYYEYIQEGMNSHNALQKAMSVTLCFIIVSKI